MSKLEIALATMSEMLRPMDWTLVGRVSTQQLLVGIEVGCATVLRPSVAVVVCLLSVTLCKAYCG